MDEPKGTETKVTRLSGPKASAPGAKVVTKRVAPHTNCCGGYKCADASSGKTVRHG